MVIDIDRDIYISEGLSDESEGNSDGPKNGGRKTTVTKQKKTHGGNRAQPNICFDFERDRTGFGDRFITSVYLVAPGCRVCVHMMVACPRVRVGGHVCVACRPTPSPDAHQGNVLRAPVRFASGQERLEVGPRVVYLRGGGSKREERDTEEGIVCKGMIVYLSFTLSLSLSLSLSL